MSNSQKIVGAFLLISFGFLQACNKSFVVKNVNYAQHIESVLTPDSNGVVEDVRYGLSYSILPFQFEEFQDSSKVMISEVRMMRNSDGFYFITADRFKNVYVMKPQKGELKLEKKILVSESGLASPVFNWRKPVVQLIDKVSAETYLLNEKGIYIIKEEQS
ncbi:MAG: hypothetical protein RLN81_12560 [Balneolaceae bacterium]